MAKSKKSVNINLGTINADSIEKMSAYHVAHCELRKLREAKKADIEKVEAEIAKLKESRKEALEAGESIDVVSAKFDILPLSNKINAINEAFKNACKPHNQAKKEALSLIPETIYHAYLLAMSTGDSSKKGTVVTKRDKDGNVKESVKIEKSLNQLIKDFANTIGLGNADNESAIAKFANLMAMRTNGMIKSNKGEDYIKVKSESQYKEVFMLALFQYAIVDKKVIDVCEDNSLKMHEFEK